MIILTRAQAASANSLMLAATLENAEIYTPDARIFKYEHESASTEQWSSADFSLSIQDIAIISDADASFDTRAVYAILSADGDVVYFSQPERAYEVIQDSTPPHRKSAFYGEVFKLQQIGAHQYACGSRGQIYQRRRPSNWQLLSDAVLLHPDAVTKSIRSSPGINDPGYMDWLLSSIHDPATRNILFNDIKGMSNDSIYICGETGPGTKPVLCYWDGTTLHELKLPISEGALTGIYIENRDSVWICGREGLILHGSWARGFNPVGLPTRNNLFHCITPYREKLVLASSVRPGGLYELDPKTGEFGRFNPPLPPLTQSSAELDAPKAGPYYAEAFGNVLWVVGLRDIYRFDGAEWERIKHPDMP